MKITEFDFRIFSYQKNKFFNCDDDHKMILDILHDDSSEVECVWFLIECKYMMEIYFRGMAN